MNYKIEHINVSSTNYPFLSPLLKGYLRGHSASWIDPHGERAELEIVDHKGKPMFSDEDCTGTVFDFNGGNPADDMKIFGNEIWYRESTFRGWNFVADLKTGKTGKNFVDDDGIDKGPVAEISMAVNDSTLNIVISSVPRKTVPSPVHDAASGVENSLSDHGYAHGMSSFGTYLDMGIG